MKLSSESTSNLEEAEILSSQELTLSQTTNFQLFQTTRVCRQFLNLIKMVEMCSKKGRKHCGKKKNCSQ